MSSTAILPCWLYFGPDSVYLWLAGGGTGSNFCPNMQTAEWAVVLGYFTSPFLVLNSWRQPNKSSVCWIRAVFSINTGGSASQQGANKVFWIHFSLILWINRANSTRQQDVFIYSQERRVRSLHWKHTHRIHSLTTPLWFSRKTQKHQQFLENQFLAFQILLFFKFESSY